MNDLELENRLDKFKKLKRNRMYAVWRERVYYLERLLDIDPKYSSLAHRWIGISLEEAKALLKEEKESNL